MRYLLDTDICSYAIRARDRGLLAILQNHARSGADLSISAVTYAELRLGAERSQNAARHHQAIRAFSSRLSDVLAWDRGRRGRVRDSPSPAAPNRASDRQQRRHDRRPHAEPRPGAGHQQREALLPSAGIVGGELVLLILDVRVVAHTNRRPIRQQAAETRTAERRRGRHRESLPGAESARGSRHQPRRAPSRRRKSSASVQVTARHSKGGPHFAGRTGWICAMARAPRRQTRTPFSVPSAARPASDVSRPAPTASTASPAPRPASAITS